MGLPALEQRTVLATLERALDRAPDDVVQIDRYKVQKALLRESGPTGWDREAAGIRGRRGGVTS